MGMKRPQVLEKMETLPLPFSVPTVICARFRLQNTVV